MVEILQNLAREGTTVITTIHQPSADIFEMFDNILIMKDGKVLTYGTSEETMQTFKENGLECPEYTNPAEFYLDTAMDRLGLYTKNLEQIMEKYQQRSALEVEEAKEKALNSIKGKVEGKSVNKKEGISRSKSIVTTQRLFAKLDPEEERLDKEYKDSRNGWLYRYKVLLNRAFRSILRDPKGLTASVISVKKFLFSKLALIFSLFFLAECGDVYHHRTRLSSRCQWRPVWSAE